MYCILLLPPDGRAVGLGLGTAAGCGLLDPGAPLPYAPPGDPPGAGVVGVTTTGVINAEAPPRSGSGGKLNELVGGVCTSGITTNGAVDIEVPPGPLFVSKPAPICSLGAAPIFGSKAPGTTLPVIEELSVERLVVVGAIGFICRTVALRPNMPPPP